MLMLGTSAGAPTARAGQRVAIEIDGLGRLEHTLVAEASRGTLTRRSRTHEARRPHEGARMKRARVAYAGAIHEATPHAQGLRLADGRVVAEDAVVWLAPFEVGTIIALGLNYADHAKELSFGKQEEPLVFLKGPGSVVGHRGVNAPAEGRDLHALRVRARGGDRRRRSRRSAKPTPCSTWPATRWPTTTRSATTWRTGTGPTRA